MGPGSGFEVFDRVPQRRARHRRRVAVEEGDQPRPVVLAAFAQHTADRLVDEVFVVAEQPLGDRERIVEIIAADEEQRGEDRRASLPEVRRSGEVTEQIPRLVDQVATDDVPGTEVDQVPVVDPVDPAEVQVDEGRGGRRRWPCELPPAWP